MHFILYLFYLFSMVGRAVTLLVEALPYNPKVTGLIRGDVMGIFQ
jgi:hypothetical protein